MLYDNLFIKNYWKIIEVIKIFDLSNVAKRQKTIVKADPTALVAYLQTKTKKMMIKQKQKNQTKQKMSISNNKNKKNDDNEKQYNV